MSAIRLQFSTDANMISRIVRWFSHGPYSHVDVVDDDGSLIGARLLGGVKRRSPDYANFSATKVVSVDVDPVRSAIARQWLEAQIGKPYDFTAILAFATDRDWREPDSWFCSELTAVFLEKSCAFPHKIYAPNNKLTPCDLLLALSAAVSLA